MKIILDTNVVAFQDWYLNKPDFSLFETFLVLSKAKLVVPQLVVEETKNKYRGEVENTIKAVSEYLEKLNRLLMSSILTPPSVSSESACSGYERDLHERLNGLDTEMPSHSDIPHDDIVKRDLAQRRPFKRSNKGSTGYRDTLIWEVILRKVAVASEETVFITQNYKDFGESKTGELHKDLKEDLRLNGLPDNCVQLCNSIHAFNEKYAKPKFTALAEAKTQLEKGAYHGFSITSWFEDNREQIISALQTKADSSGWHSPLPIDVDEPTILNVENPSPFEINDIYELDVDRVYIDICADIIVDLDCYLDKYDYWGMPKDILLDISTQDWSEHCFWATITLEVSISLTMTFNIKEERVEEFEADFMEIFGCCKSCGKAITWEVAEDCPGCGKSLSG